MASELGVQTIQHTNGTDAMTIDSSGRVNTPARPAFYAYADDGWVGLTNGTYTTAALNHTQFNIGSCYDVSNYKFVAPVAGIYSFSSGAYFDSSVKTRIRLVDASSTELAFSILDQDAAGISHKMHSIIQLSASDEVTFKVRVDSGADGSSDVYYDVNHTFFSGFLVG